MATRNKEHPSPRWDVLARSGPKDLTGDYVIFPVVLIANLTLRLPDWAVTGFIALACRGCRLRRSSAALRRLAARRRPGLAPENRSLTCSFSLLS